MAMERVMDPVDDDGAEYVCEERPTKALFSAKALEVVVTAPMRTVNKKKRWERLHVDGVILFITIVGKDTM